MLAATSYISRFPCRRLRSHAYADKLISHRNSVQGRQDYPAVSETLQGQVTKLVNVMRTIAGIDGFSDVS